MLDQARRRCGHNGDSVSQSGVSKEMDAETGGKLLSSIAKSLARAETILAEYALLTLRHRPITSDERQTIRVTYPVKFALRSAAELIDGTTKLQLVIGNCRGSAQYRARADPGNNQAVAPGTQRCRIQGP